jgi:predicted glycosyltransferase
MEDIQLIKELQDKLNELEARHNKEFNDIHEILDQLLKSKNEENQKENTKSKA